MATPLAVRPSHSSVGSVAAGRRLGVEGVAPARVAWAAGTRGAKGFTLRCSLDESSAASGSTSPVVDVAPPTIHLEILGVQLPFPSYLHLLIFLCQLVFSFCSFQLTSAVEFLVLSTTCIQLLLRLAESIALYPEMVRKLCRDGPQLLFLQV